MLLGIMGLPVFAKGGGIGYILDANFSYALVFFPMVLVTGLLRRRVWPALACALGVAALYAVALSYIALLTLALGKQLPSLGTFLPLYFVLFFPVDLIQGVLASFLYLLLQKRSLALA